MRSRAVILRMCLLVPCLALSCRAGCRREPKPLDEASAPAKEPWLSKVGQTRDDPRGVWTMTEKTATSWTVTLDRDRDGIPEGKWTSDSAVVDSDHDGNPEFRRTNSGGKITIVRSSKRSVCETVAAPTGQGYQVTNSCSVDGSVVRSDKEFVSLPDAFRQSYTDPLRGEQVFSCRDPEKVAAAFRKASARLEVCLGRVFPGAAFDLSLQLERPVQIVCTSLPGACGYSPGAGLSWGLDTPLRIEINEGAFADPTQCDNMTKTVGHEILHYIFGPHFGGETSLDSVRACTELCLEKSTILAQATCWSCTGDMSGESDAKCSWDFCGSERCPASAPNCVTCEPVTICTTYDQRCLSCGNVKAITKASDVCVRCNGKETIQPGGSGCCEAWGRPPGSTNSHDAQTYLWDWKLCPPGTMPRVHTTPGYPWDMNGTCHCDPQP